MQLSPSGFPGETQAGQGRCSVCYALQNSELWGTDPGGVGHHLSALPITCPPQPLELTVYIPGED